MNKEEAGIAEQYHIAGYKTFINGWNKSDGGEKLLDGKDHPRYIDGRTYDMKAYMKAYNATPEAKAKKKEYNARYHKAYYLRKKAEKLTISSTCL